MSAGIVLILAALLFWVVGVHFRARRYFDRPTLARNPWFDPIVATLRWLLLAAGLIVLVRSSPPAAAAAAAILTAGWGYRRLIRSVAFRRWLMRRDFAAARQNSPDLPDREILLRLVMQSHPGWGEELIEQMVHDHPKVDRLARMVAKMERGFRGVR